MKKVISLIVLLMLIFSLPAYSQTRKTGVYKVYYKDGTIKTETTYKNGLREGPRKKYDEQGRLVQHLIYEKGELSGEVYVHEPRDWGPLGFLFSWKFWLGIISVMGILWFLIAKVFLKNKVF